MSKLMSLTTAVATRTALTVPQLEGWACVICAVLGIPAVFVGIIGGREVYACNTCANNTPFTGDQLDGVACIRCHATDAPMIPAGTGERGQLFACATHTAPTSVPESSVTACPSWCRTDHNGVEVEHVSESMTVAAPEGSEVKGDDGIARQVEVVAELRQEPHEPLRLSLGVCEGVECLTDTEMSLDEAELLVARLQTLITAARTGARSS